MQKRSANIIAPNEEEALQKGQKELDTAEANLQCKRIAEDKFQVSTINADAELEVIISHDGLKAYIADYQGPIGEGTPLDKNKIMQILDNSGIRFGHNSETLDVVLEKIASQDNIKDLEIASGILPQEPEDAYIELYGNHEYPVFAYNSFGKVIPPEPAKTGKRVDGLPFFPNEKREPKPLEIKENCGWVLDEDSGEVIAKGYGKVLQKDGQIKIKPLVKLSNDGLSLLATIYHLDFQENPITVEDIKKVALDLGCQEETILEKEISKALKKAKKHGEPQKEVPIASGGTKPQEPQDAYIELYGNKDFPVFPGQAFGKIVGPVWPQTGLSVIGTSIPPQNDSHPKELEAPEKAFWYIDKDSEQVIAKAYGKVIKDNGQFKIRPLLQISKDHLKMYATISHQDYFNNPITLEQIKKTVSELTTTIKLKEANILQGLKDAAASGKSQKKVLIAEGSPSESGNDAKLILHNKENKNTDETGRIDFHKISAFYSVNEGDVIATLLPPGAGQTGVDIFGNKIESQPGRSLDFTPGNNVESRKSSVSPQSLADFEDLPEHFLDNYKNNFIQITEFLALSSGTVIIEEGKISISDFVEINGDVDYSTGNICLKKGSVKINNTILSGFTVTSPEDILVSGTIEDAHVEAGKNIIVKCGITAGEWGKIKSGGNIQAHFIKNANIECGQDLIVYQHISNSHIKAQGSVIANKGKGKIQGGTIKAGLGLDANEIGSEYGIKTKIFLGKEFDHYQGLIDEKDEVRESLEKVKDFLCDQDPKKVLENCPPQNKTKIEQLLAYKESAEKRLQEIQEQIKLQRNKYLTEIGKVKAKVRKVVHPETEFYIAKKRYLVQETLYNITVYYDSEKDVINIK
jgi:uncharacterized protein (DUF342 family)